ncbi:MAG: hypothetical protein H6736_04605 [Alphaproteobacteria bacterium]|nr:hypothetical protein [Alphaproteobacteria bacterium]
MPADLSDEERSRIDLGRACARVASLLPWRRVANPCESLDTPRDHALMALFPEAPFAFGEPVVEGPRHRLASDRTYVAWSAAAADGLVVRVRLDVYDDGSQTLEVYDVAEGLLYTRPLEGTSGLHRVRGGLTSVILVAGDGQTSRVTRDGLAPLASLPDGYLGLAEDAWGWWRIGREDGVAWRRWDPETGGFGPVVRPDAASEQPAISAPEGVWFLDGRGQLVQHGTDARLGIAGAPVETVLDGVGLFTGEVHYATREDGVTAHPGDCDYRVENVVGHRTWVAMDDRHLWTRSLPVTETTTSDR